MYRQRLGSRRTPLYNLNAGEHVATCKPEDLESEGLVLTASDTLCMLGCFERWGCALSTNEVQAQDFASVHAAEMPTLHLFASLRCTCSLNDSGNA